MYDIIGITFFVHAFDGQLTMRFRDLNPFKSLEKQKKKSLDIILIEKHWKNPGKTQMLNFSVERSIANNV